jgi:hypothetical protein
MVVSIPIGLDLTVVLRSLTNLNLSSNLIEVGFSFMQCFQNEQLGFDFRCARTYIL